MLQTKILIFLHTILPLQIVLPEKLFIDSITAFGTKAAFALESIQAKSEDGSWRNIVVNIEPKKNGKIFTKAFVVNWLNFV